MTQAELTQPTRQTDLSVIEGAQSATEIDLVELKRQDNIKNTKLADAVLETWPQVVEFQKLHGYKFAWCIRYAAAHVIPIPSNYNYMRKVIGV